MACVEDIIYSIEQGYSKEVISDLLNRTREVGFRDLSVRNDWQQVLRYYDTGGENKTVGELCYQLAQIEKPRFIKDMRKIFIANIEAIVATLTLSNDFAVEQSGRLEDWFKKRDIKKYRKILLSS